MSSSSENGSVGNHCEFQSNIVLIREIPFFSGLPIETIKVVAYLCERQFFQKGQYLFRQKNDDGRAFFIISGKGVLTHQHDKGEIEIRTYEKKTFIGGLSLLTHLPRLFSLKALTDISCLVMERQMFLKSLEQFPDLFPHFIKVIASEIAGWEKRLMQDHGYDLKGCHSHIGLSLM